MKSNVFTDSILKKREAEGKLTIADNVTLALADALAELFPELPIHTGPVRQDVRLPCWFVSFYEMVNSQKLDDLTEYEFGFDLEYWPKNRSSNAEINAALYTALQGLYRLQNDGWEYTVYRKNSAVTDRVGHVTGVVKALEQTISDDPIIQKAEKEVTI